MKKIKVAIKRSKELELSEKEKKIYKRNYNHFYKSFGREYDVYDSGYAKFIKSVLLDNITWWCYNIYGE